MNLQKLKKLTDEEKCNMVADICYMNGDQYAHDNDYPNDLNAMHKAVDSLEGKDREIYLEKLIYVCTGYPERKFSRKYYDWTLSEATAKQRAEAFILTMTKEEDS